MLDHTTTPGRSRPDHSQAISPVAFLYTRSPPKDNKVADIIADWSAGIKGLIPLAETFAAGHLVGELNGLFDGSNQSFEYPFDSITQRMKHPHQHHDSNPTSDNHHHHHYSQNFTVPTIKYPFLGDDPMIPTPNPSPLKPKRSRSTLGNNDANHYSNTYNQPSQSSSIAASNNNNNTNQQQSSFFIEQQQQTSTSTNLQKAASILQSALKSSPQRHRHRHRRQTLAAKTQGLDAALESLRQKRKDEAEGLILLLKSREGALGSYGKELRKFRGNGEGGDGNESMDEDEYDNVHHLGANGGDSGRPSIQRLAGATGTGVGGNQLLNSDDTVDDEEDNVLPTPMLLSTASSSLTELGSIKEGGTDYDDDQEDNQEEHDGLDDTDTDYHPNSNKQHLQHLHPSKLSTKSTVTGLTTSSRKPKRKRATSTNDPYSSDTAATNSLAPSPSSSTASTPATRKPVSTRGGGRPKTQDDTALPEYLSFFHTPSSSVAATNATANAAAASFSTRGGSGRKRTRSELIGKAEKSSCYYQPPSDTAYLLTSAAEMLSKQESDEAAVATAVKVSPKKKNTARIEWGHGPITSPLSDDMAVDEQEGVMNGGEGAVEEPNGLDLLALALGFE
ncbi:UNVERIFIED_CONTAM: hypothetical protein HDU68_010266 [Siphonaria sp. JEL0065]|nr:hypothetical protein HDU68_010266 [Siphonaria sp. JEL0065]